MNDEPISSKIAHIKAAIQSRFHECHWPGCKKQVPPALWGCREHWYTLPKYIRQRIWKEYSSGQEETLSPSREYINAAQEAQNWIADHGKISK